MLLIIITAFNTLDIVWTVYAVNEWNRLAYNGISLEQNPISKHIMLNYGLNAWIFIKCIISLIGLCVFIVMEQQFIPSPFSLQF